VLQVQEIAKPAPKDNEVLVEVRAVSVNAGDMHLLNGKPLVMRLMGFGFFKPKNPILGSAIAGRVEAVGASVTQFKPGDEVFGDLSDCGWGGFAEYVCASEDALVLKPSKLSFEEAAAVPNAAVTALQGLRNKAQIQPGQKVLIKGASGGVGTFAVQIAKAFGAEVTAVCSTRNVDIMRSIGADHVIDYTQEDFSRNGQQYDLILAANGDVSISDYRRALSLNGTYVMSGGSNKQLMEAMLLGAWISKTGSQKMGNLMATPNHEDLVFMKGLLEAGKVVPVIDRCYPFNEGIEAIRYVVAGHAKGKVVVSVRQ
jgi:NADPH:quinone reductase-like Zn-dependent oxidoreductase